MHSISKASIDHIRGIFLSGQAAAENPSVFCMAGIPGAGKSTFVNNALAAGQFPADAFILDPDRVMAALPEYQNDMSALGAIEAYARWEMPARDLAYAMFEEAAASRFNIIKDMGCARTENFEKLKALKAQGYKLFMYHIECDISEALRRIALRSRHTPGNMVRERAESLQELLPLYRELADLFTDVRPDQRHVA